MIHIINGQEVKDSPDYIAMVPTGDYDEIDLIECAHKKNPSQSICMFQAQYIAFGKPVYHQEEVLTEEQVSRLLDGANIEDVINNKDLINGFKRKEEDMAGRIFGKNGMVRDRDVIKKEEKPKKEKPKIKDNLEEDDIPTPEDEEETLPPPVTNDGEAEENTGENGEELEIPEDTGDIIEEGITKIISKIKKKVATRKNSRKRG